MRYDDKTAEGFRGPHDRSHCDLLPRESAPVGCVSSAGRSSRRCISPAIRTTPPIHSSTARGERSCSLRISCSATELHRLVAHLRASPRPILPHVLTFVLRPRPPRPYDPCSELGRAGLSWMTAALDEELAALQRALNGDEQLVNVDRLHEGGVRAELQELDHDFRVEPAGGDDDCRIRVLEPDLHQQPDARIAHPHAVHPLADPHHHRRSEVHTSELQSHSDLVCRLLLEKKK